MTDHHQKQDYLRVRWLQLKNKLAETALSSPGRDLVEENLRKTIERLRQLIQDRAMDLCTDPDCTLDGTVTHEGKQWCPVHDPARKPFTAGR